MSTDKSSRIIYSKASLDGSKSSELAFVSIMWILLRSMPQLLRNNSSGNSLPGKVATGDNMTSYILALILASAYALIVIRLIRT